MLDRRTLRVVGGLMAVLVSGCATMFSGSSQSVRVRVTPNDATTTVNGREAKFVGDTVTLDRNRPHTIAVSKPGYTPRQVMVKQDLNGWFLANILWGPFFWIGMLVDALTGSVNELSPTDLSVSLEAGTGPSTIASSGSGAAPPSSSPSSPSSSSSSQSSFSVTFVSPSGPSLDPLSNVRGTAVGPRGTASSPQSRTTPTPAPTVTTPTPSGPSPTPPSAAGSIGSHGSVGGTQASPAPARPSAPSVSRTLVSGPQREWVLAVMNTELAGSSKTLSRDIRSALTDQVRVFLAERGLKVVDRSSQEAALRSLVEEEKAKSYKTCVDESCQIPLGKALAASHIMKSTVAVFGKACTTNGELIDLRAEVTVAAGSARSGCEPEDLLVAAEQLAEELVVSSSRRQP